MLFSVEQATSIYESIENFIFNEEAYGKLYERLIKSLQQPLPTYLRPDVVTDACFLLRPEENANKTVEDRVRFLASKDVCLNEIAAALRLSPQVVQPQPEILIRSARKYRDDIVESATYFFKSEKTQHISVEDRITFLIREKNLTVDEVDIVLEICFIPRLIPEDGQDAQKAKRVVDRDSLLALADRFLDSKAAAQQSSEEEIKAFLSKQGLTDQEITELILRKANDGNRIARAVEFLRTTKATTPKEQQISYLQTKLTEQQLQEALKQYENPNNSEEKQQPTTTSNESPKSEDLKSANIKRALAFLQSPAAKGAPRDKLETFLRNKNLSEDEIRAAFARLAESPSVLPSDPPIVAKDAAQKDPLVEQAVSFLQSPTARNAANPQLVTNFLLKKGLTLAQIQIARERVGSPVSPATSSSSSTNTKVDQAVAFLKNPQTLSAPKEKKVSFLKEKGLSDGEIEQAFHLLANESKPGGLKPNQTSSSSSNVGSKLNGDDEQEEEAIPVVKIPNDRVLLRRSIDLALQMDVKLSSTISNELKCKRCLFLLYFFSACVSKLRYPLAYEKEASPYCYVALVDCVQSFDFKRDNLLLEAILAEFLEVCSENHQGIFSLKYDACNLLLPVYEGLPFVDRFDLGLMLSRCVHGHFCARASVCAYNGVDWMLVVLKAVHNDTLSTVRNFMSAGLLRGAVDFGCGFGAPVVPAEEKNEKNVLPEQHIKMQFLASCYLSDVSLSPYLGLACVYLGSTWLEAEYTCLPIVHCLVDGSLTYIFHDAMSLNDCVAAADDFVARNCVFTLAASIAQLFVSQCETRADFCQYALSLLNSKVVENHKRIRANHNLFEVVAKRMVDRTYSEKLVRLSLADSLGTHAGIARVFHTHYLIEVSVMEPCLVKLQMTLSLADVFACWNSLACLGFGMVLEGDAIRLNKYLETLSSFTEDQFEVFGQVAKCVWDEQEAIVQDEDYVLAMKIEYMLQTAKRFINKPWSAVVIRNSKVVSPEVNHFAMALIYGASHSFTLLNNACHLLITNSLALVSNSRPPSDSENKDELPLAMVIIPRYVESAIRSCPKATEGSSMAFAMGFIFTNLGKNPYPEAQPLSVIAFRKVLREVTRCCFIAEEDDQSREKKTRFTVVYTILAASLKALSLPALAPCLDETEQFLRKVSFAEAFPSQVKDRQLVLPKDQINKSLFDIITRIDDAPRRAILVMWYLNCTRSTAKI